MSGLMDALRCQNLSDDELEESSLEDFGQWLDRLAEEAQAMRELKEFAKTASKEEVRAEYHKLRARFGYETDNPKTKGENDHGAQRLESN